MQVIENSRRRYFTKSQKIQILKELSSGVITHVDLARKHGIHPITLFKWKRLMHNNLPEKEPGYEDLYDENIRLNKEIENLKKALGEMAVEKQILQTANNILKKDQRRKMLKSSKKSSKR